MDPITEDSIPSQSNPIEQKQKSSVLLITLTVFFFISLVGVGTLAYQNILLQRHIAALKSQPTPPPTLAPTTDPTATWKTYSNVNDGYLFKYPNDWIIQTLTDAKDKFYSFDALGKEMTLSKTILGKNGYQMIIFRNFSGPISEEPQICVYPDSQIDSGKYAPLRFTSDMVTEIRDGGYRRSILNEYPDQIRFEVCKPRENPSAGGIIFEPAYITYLTPKKYDFKSLNEMDQILSTFKFSDQNSNAEGKFCGGIAANLPQNQCPGGYTCKMENNYPDAGGVCTKKP